MCPRDQPDLKAKGDHENSTVMTAILNHLRGVAVMSESLKPTIENQGPKKVPCRVRTGVSRVHVEKYDDEKRVGITGACPRGESTKKKWRGLGWQEKY